MMGKKKTSQHRPFESSTQSGKFVKICIDMMESAAWKALTRSQRYLYLELKSRYTAKYSSGLLISDNANDISIPTSEARALYADMRVFRADIDKLMICGFIDLEEDGYITRTVNIYGFSERWKKYGQPDFKPPKFLRSEVSEDTKEKIRESREKQQPGD